PGSGGRADGVGSPTTTAEREHEAQATALRAGCGETRSPSSTSACWTPTPDSVRDQNPTFDSMQVVRSRTGTEAGRQGRTSRGRLPDFRGRPRRGRDDTKRVCGRRLANPARGDWASTSFEVRSTRLAWGASDPVTGGPGVLPTLGAA